MLGHILKTCKNCNVSFNTHRKNKIYCSSKCHRLYNKVITNINYHKNKKPKIKQYKRNCKYCNKEFETHNKIHVFCQKKCSSTYKYKIQEKIDPIYGQKRRLQYRNSYRRLHGLPETDEKLINHPGRFKGNSKGYLTYAGYRVLHRPNHPNSSKCGSIHEQVVVMSEHLGRPLRKGENVHHKNGIRDDNRIENLELWNKTQPSGQRVEDKLEWCKEFLTQYGYTVTKNP